MWNKIIFAKIVFLRKEESVERGARSKESKTESVKQTA